MNLLCWMWLTFIRYGFYRCMWCWGKLSRRRCQNHDCERYGHLQDGPLETKA